MSRHLNVHPAPGLGNLIPGSFVVPQNPIDGGEIRYIPRIGELLPAAFTIPQNPLMDVLSSPNPLKPQRAGGCGCEGGLSGLSGLGGLDLSLGLNPFTLIAGAALVYYFFLRK